MRTIVDLTEKQICGLVEYCVSKRVSRAEAVRQAVDRMLAQSAEAEAQHAFDMAFGSWKKFGVSTDEYLEDIRSEWER